MKISQKYKLLGLFEKRDEHFQIEYSIGSLENQSDTTQKRNKEPEYSVVIVIEPEKTQTVDQNVFGEGS
jgi:hypothetical protein